MARTFSTKRAGARRSADRSAIVRDRGETACASPSLSTSTTQGVAAPCRLPGGGAGGDPRQERLPNAMKPVAGLHPGRPMRSSQSCRLLVGVSGSGYGRCAPMRDKHQRSSLRLTDVDHRRVAGTVAWTAAETPCVMACWRTLARPGRWSTEPAGGFTPPRAGRPRSARAARCPCPRRQRAPPQHARPRPRPGISGRERGAASRPAPSWGAPAQTGRDAGSECRGPAATAPPARGERVLHGG